MWLNSLSFALPLWLVGIALIAGSAALYFFNERRPSARTLMVPFIKFCEPMPKGRGRKRPRWPLLLALQIGALLFLVAAAAGLHNRRLLHGDGLVLIMDTSLSMQAKAQGVSRFEHARRAALQEIDRAGAAEEILLIAAGGRARLVGRNRPGEDLRQSLRELEVTDGSANLEAALDLAKSLLSSRAGRIHVFTDRARAIYEAWDKKCHGDHPPVTIHRFGEPAGNLAITGFSVYQSPLATDYHEVYAYLTLRNYFSQPVRAPYSVTLDGRPIASGTCDLAPGEQRTVTVRGFPGPGLLHAALNWEDALMTDNEAFGLIVPMRPLSILVVGETGGLKEQLERALDIGLPRSSPFALRFMYTTPAEVQSADWSALDRIYDLVIFDGRGPSLERATPAAGLWNGAASTTASNDYYLITDWNAQHELMEYLENFNLMRLRAGVRVPSEPWIEPIVEGRPETGSAARSDGLPIVGAGGAEGRRAVYFGFDLKDYPLAKYQHLKILLLNTLRWLHPLARRPAHVLVGEDYRLDALESAQGFTLQKPGGALRRYAPGATVVDAAEIGRQGLYRLRLDNGEERAFVGTLGTWEDESDLAVDADPLWQAPAAVLARPNDSSLSDYSYSHRSWLLALVVLLVETGLFIVYERRAVG